MQTVRSRPCATSPGACTRRCSSPRVWPPQYGAQIRRSASPIEIDADGIGRYPREVESSVYFCILEALRAVGDDAAASWARIQLSQNNGSLRFEIHGDAGVDARLESPVVPQPSLRRIGDRLDALSGTFDLRCDPDRGTTLTGDVPLGSRAVMTTHVTGTLAAV